MAEQQNGPQRRIKRRTFKDIILLLLILLVLFLVSLYFLFPAKRSGKRICHI